MIYFLGLIFFTYTNICKTDDRPLQPVPEECLIRPFATYLYIMSNDKNKVWIPCDDWNTRFLIVNLTFVIRVHDHLLEFQHFIWLHLKRWNITMENGILPYQQNTSYILFAYDFFTEFKPISRILQFSVDNVITCIPGPADPNADYSIVNLDPISDSLVVPTRNGTLELIYNSSLQLINTTICFACHCEIIYLRNETCYSFIGKLTFTRSSLTVFQPLTETHDFEANYVDDFSKRKFPADCIIKSVAGNIKPKAFVGIITIDQTFPSGEYIITCEISHLKPIYDNTVMIFILSDLPLEILPKDNQFNNSYSSKLSCQLKKAFQKYSIELVFVPIDMPKIYYNTNWNNITITPNGDLDGKKYCFVCSISIFNLTKCYSFMGFYNLVILPAIDILYISKETLISCNRYSGMSHFDVITVNVPDLWKKYSFVHEDKTMVFEADMALHGRYICLQCAKGSAHTSHCYTLIVTMRLKCDPEDDEYNLYYFTPLLKFSFVTDISPNLFKATCMIIKGVVWADPGNTFQLTQSVPLDTYGFNCSMDSYNYSDTVHIKVTNRQEYANISPISGILEYMTNGFIKCTSLKTSYNRKLRLSVNQEDEKYVKRIHQNEYEIKKEFSSRNRKIWFFCYTYVTKLDEEWYTLFYSIDFIYTPNRPVYYILENNYYIYPRFYNKITNASYTTVCVCKTCPPSISQIKTLIRILMTAPDGTFTFNCTLPDIPIFENLIITTSHARVALKIVPKLDTIYTSVVNHIKCQYDKSLSLMDSYFDFLVTYPIKEAYSKQSYVYYLLVSDIKYHNSEICFKCNLDDVVIRERCYLWKGFFTFFREPVLDIYFKYYHDIITIYYINQNDTYATIKATCYTIIGIDSLFEDPMTNEFSIKHMALGKYMVKCQMLNLNQYDYFNMTIDYPGRPLFKSNKYPDVYNATHTLLIPEEEITFTLFYENLFPDINCYWFHSYETTSVTPSRNARDEKNSVLSVEENLLTILAGLYGFDFLICTQCDVKGQRICIQINYTIGNPPSEANINTSFYVVFLEVISFVSNAFPIELIYYKSGIKNRVLSEYSHFSYCTIPMLTYFGYNELNVTIYLHEGEIEKMHFWKSRKISIRVFRTFQWSNVEAAVQHYNDNLICQINLLAPYRLEIVQIKGESKLPYLDDHSIKLVGVSPGLYKLACVMHVTTIEYGFHRFKEFQLYSTSTRICFLPFAPSLGMLIKCISSQYPTVGSYQMVFTDVVSDLNLVIQTRSTLRIPYIIPVNRKYKISCQYSDDNFITQINQEFFLKSSYKLSLFQERNPCWITESIPQEYEYCMTELGHVFTYSKLYYLIDTNKNRLHLCIIVFVIALVCLFPVFCIHIFLRIISLSERQNKIIRINKHFRIRIVVRKLNEVSQSRHKLDLSGLPADKLKILANRVFELSPMY